MQAVKYAAMASRFEPEVLAAHHARFLQARTGNNVSDVEALTLLDEHTVDPLDPDSLRHPRIVLVAASFKSTTMASVVWLNEMGVDIRLVQTRAYRAGSEVILTASAIYPPPNTEDFVISPRLPKRERVRADREQRREISAVKRLVSAGAIPDGTRLRFHVAEGRTVDEAQITEWLAADAARSDVRWTNDPISPLLWAVDGKRYAPTTLVRKILEESLGLQLSAIRGPVWWTTDDGRNLVEIVEAVSPTPSRNRRTAAICAQS
jgi:hypothetical protein